MRFSNEARRFLSLRRRIARRHPLRQPSSVQASPSASASVNRFARRHSLRQPSPVQATVVRSSHCRPHQSAPTESRIVNRSDNRHPFRPSSPASISTNRVARRQPLRSPYPFKPSPSASINANRFACRPSLRLLLFVQPAAIRFDQCQPIRTLPSTPTTIVRSSRCRPHQPAPYDSPAVIYFDNHRSFRHRRPHQSASTESRVVIHSDNHHPFRHRRPHQSASTELPTVICINQRQPIRPPPSISTTVVRSDHRRPHQSAATESRVVSCSGRRHLLRSTPSLRLPPCASSNIIRFTRRPSRRVPAAPLGHFFHMGVGGATASGKIGCGEGGGGAVRFLRDFALFLQKCAENRAFDRIRSGRIGCFVRPAAPA